MIEYGHLTLSGDTIAGKVFMGEYLNASFNAKRHAWPAANRSIARSIAWVASGLPAPRNGPIGVLSWIPSPASGFRLMAVAPAGSASPASMKRTVVIPENACMNGSALSGNRYSVCKSTISSPRNRPVANPRSEDWPPR